MTPLRVMIVHPEGPLARRLSELVAKAGHAPIVVPDGERAIDRFVQEPVEVIVVEYFLPGRDGVTTVESIRWAPKGREVKVLLLADAEPEVAPLAALGARIDAIETLLGEPDDATFLRALSLTTRQGSAPKPLPIPTFDDDTATGQPPESILSKSAATRFDDESTVQGSAEVARAILGKRKPGSDGATAPAIDAAMEIARRKSAEEPAPPAEPRFHTAATKPGNARPSAENAPNAGTAKPSGETEWRRDPGTVAEAKEVRKDAARAEKSEITNTGRFEDTAFPMLLARLADEKTTGALICRGEGITRETTNGDAPTKVVYFRGGVPTYVRSNLLDECLGQLLLRQRKIGKATLEESVRKMLRGEGRQGEILVELGALSPIVLGEALATQAREKLYDLFGWQRGAWRMSTSVEAPRDVTLLELGLPEIVYEGVCAAMPATRLLDALAPSFDLFVVPSPERLARFARVRVPTELRPILTRLDGSGRLRAMLGAGGRAGGVAQLIYALLCLGAVRFEKEASKVPRIPADDDLGSSQDYAPRVAGMPRAQRAPDVATPEWEDETSRQGPAPRPMARRDVRSDPPPAPASEERDPSTDGDRPTKKPPRPSFSPDALPPASEELVMSPPPPALAAASPPPPAPAGPPVVGGAELDARVDRLFEAERHFRRGCRALERQKLDDALAAFLRASELCPAEGEFLAYVGWARSVASPDDEAATEAALRELAQASELSPGLYVTHLLLARVLRRVRRTGEATRAYERVLGLEPQNAEATESLAQLRGG